MRRPDLDAITEAAAALDELFAKARLAARMDGTAPALTTDGRIEFRGARHPLLIPAVRDLTASTGSGLPFGERGPTPSGPVRRLRQISS